MLTRERLSARIADVQARIAALEPDVAANLDTEMAITFEEHFRFQQLQAEAHVTQVLDTDAAQLVYVALGEVGSEKNGGWAAKTSTATKVVVTLLMTELLTAKVGSRR